MKDEDVRTVEGNETTLPSVPEVDRLRMHNHFLQQQVYQEQLNGLLQRFMLTEHPKKLQERIEEVTIEINMLADRIFKAAGLDPGMYQFDAAQGVFVQRSERS